MEGKWTICLGPQPDTIFQSQNLVHFLCKYQKRETPSQVREGEATALRLGQYYLEDEETERSFFFFLPTPFNPRIETPRSAKVREILQFSYSFASIL